MDNEPLSSITHAIGVLLSIAAVVLLIVYAETAWHIVSVAIFGSFLILVYLASTVYHFLPKNTTAKIVFQRIDQAMIYLLIAGTYTPVCFIILQGALRWIVFGVIWGLAVIGIVLRSLDKAMVFSVVLYLIMGWLALFIVTPLREATNSIVWLVVGGVLYSLGVIFLVLDDHLPRSKWWGMHEIFHLFVLAGSIAHFFFVLGVL